MHRNQHFWRLRRRIERIDVHDNSMVVVAIGYPNRLREESSNLSRDCLPLRELLIKLLNLLDLPLLAWICDFWHHAHRLLWVFAQVLYDLLPLTLFYSKSFWVERLVVYRWGFGVLSERLDWLTSASPILHHHRSRSWFCLPWLVLVENSSNILWLLIGIRQACLLTLQLNRAVFLALHKG